MNNFYVYEHWRPDTGVCFYVGKGKDNRAWDMKYMRNRHHMAITSKLTSMGLCVDVRIIQKDMIENDAFALEIKKIAFYGIENLSNMTGGGDGMKNPSLETRKKISESQKIRFQNPDERKKASNRNKGRITSEETKRKLSISSLGRNHTLETKEKMRILAKIRGVSQATRDAQKAFVTGRKRAPFTAETLKKMSDAARAREHRKRLERAC